MVYFITVLRALAACLITNSHYTEVYPTDLIANGGLIGDIVFFCVSGYCLYNVKESFQKWYSKRVYRVYVPVIVVTLIYSLIGFYCITSEKLIKLFVYPTKYHFVASIIILYIPFYIVMKVKWLKERLPQVMIVTAIVWLTCYFVFFDRTYYHIDNVYEPMIRFLFFESMLLGAWFKENDSNLRNKSSGTMLIGGGISFVVYFASKLVFSRCESLSGLQFINQILIFVLLYFVFRVFCGLDEKLEGLPIWIKKIIGLLADITLEIYVVQYVIIDRLRNVAFFPFNWLILTGTILVAAWILSRICELIYAGCSKLSIKLC